MHDVQVAVPKRSVWQRIDDGQLWQSRGPWLARVATLGRLAALGLFALGGVLCFALAVVAIHDRGVPVTWGHFTQTSTICNSVGRSRDCTITGDWVSNDGKTSRTGVSLDGNAAPGETVAAGYRNGGWNSDADNNVVHTRTWIDAGPWVSLLGATFCIGVGASYWKKWNGGWRRVAPSVQEYQPRHTSAG